jgi:hypothetical protein
LNHSFFLGSWVPAPICSRALRPWEAIWGCGNRRGIPTDYCSISARRLWRRNASLRHGLGSKPV